MPLVASTNSPTHSAPCSPFHNCTQYPLPSQQGACFPPGDTGQGARKQAPRCPPTKRPFLENKPKPRHTYHWPTPSRIPTADASHAASLRDYPMHPESTTPSPPPAQQKVTIPRSPNTNIIHTQDLHPQPRRPCSRLTNPLGRPTTTQTQGRDTREVPEATLFRARVRGIRRVLHKG